MSAEHPNRAVYVVDWDGTCVEEVWPGMGDWLPGAVEALRELSSKGKTVIYSLRCHQYEQDDLTARTPESIATEVTGIRAMLDAAGLHDVEVYPNGRGKPPGRFYIDDRAVQFKSWDQALTDIEIREERRERGWS